MTIDIDKLRAWLAAGTARPWRVIDEHRDGERNILNVMGPEVRRPKPPMYGEGTWDDSERIVETDCGVYGPQPADADLIIAAVNSLEPLLAVYAAACAWRDVPGDTVSDERLVAAIDAARKGESR